MTTDLRRPALGVYVCAACKGLMYWVGCPTGGWWAHDRHPADEHDASTGDLASQADIEALLAPFDRTGSAQQ